MQPDININTPTTQGPNPCDLRSLVPLELPPPDCRNLPDPGRSIDSLTPCSVRAPHHNRRRSVWLMPPAVRWTRRRLPNPSPPLAAAAAVALVLFVASHRALAAAFTRPPKTTTGGAGRGISAFGRIHAPSSTNIPSLLLSSRLALAAHARGAFIGALRPGQRWAGARQMMRMAQSNAGTP